MPDLKPWKVISSRAVYSAPPYLTVHSHEVELPDGRTVTPYFRIDLRSFVVMAAVTAQNEVVVGRQYRHGIEQISLMLPGGLLEPKEDPLVAAQRELAEETGFISDEWEPLGRFVPNSNYRCGETFIFLARNARQVMQPNSGDLEETELMLMPLPDLLQEIDRGSVISLTSAAAISLASARLARGGNEKS
jgi:ADP-ribose pyrophosphatase